MDSKNRDDLDDSQYKFNVSVFTLEDLDDKEDTQKPMTDTGGRCSWKHRHW